MKPHSNQKLTACFLRCLRWGLGGAALLCGAAWFLCQGPLDTAITAEPKKTLEQYNEDLRKRYPFESLEKRLAYEADYVQAHAKDSADLKLTEGTKKRLELFEKSLRFRRAMSGRRQVLWNLHENEVKEFVGREGFGLIRLSGLKNYFELPAAPTVPFAAAAADWQPGETVALPIDDGASAGTNHGLPTLGLVDALHDRGRLDFLNIDGLGVMKARRQVAGFQPHQFRQLPELTRPKVKDQPPAKEGWIVRRLELVSLLKHDKPTVYVTDQAPRMDKLKEAKTRPLDQFEEQALKALQKGEDTVVEASTNRIRLMGSLRATKQCLDCHHGKRGDLLGTFSYDIHRDPALRNGK